MGQGLLSRFKRAKDINVAVLGLYESGKTTLLQKLVDKVNVTIPSIGMVVEEVNYKYYHMTSWDIGGRGVIRPISLHYYNITDALVFVLDSTDREYYHDRAAAQFQRLLEEETLLKVPLVVLANKQDLPGAMSCREMAEGLQLDKVRRDREAEIFGTSGLTGEGIIDALQWIASAVRHRDIKESVVSPVEKAVPPSLKKIYHTVGSTLKTVFETGAKDKAVVPPTA